MCSVLRRAAFAAVAASLAASPATADTRVYYHAGVWDVFSGQDDNGRPVCGVGHRNAADGRTFSMRYEIGGDALIFKATKPAWNIPSATQLPVAIQIDADQSWQAQALGNGQGVEWALDRSAALTFDAQFRHGVAMTISFPSGSEPPWVIPLRGSTAASNAMGVCITDLRQRAGPQGPTQPYGAAAPVTPAPAQGPTQPFGAAPPVQPQSAPPPATQPNPPNTGG